MATWREQYVVRQYNIVLFNKFYNQTYATHLFDVTKTDNRLKLNKTLMFGLQENFFSFTFFEILWTHGIPS